MARGFRVLIVWGRGRTGQDPSDAICKRFNASSRYCHSPRLRKPATLAYDLIHSSPTPGRGQFTFNPMSFFFFFLGTLASSNDLYLTESSDGNDTKLTKLTW